MKVNVYADYDSLSRATADLVADYVAAKKNSIICLASGHTPHGMFTCLRNDVKSGRLDLSHCTFVSLDEWVGIPSQKRGSCRHMMDEDLFIPLNIKDSQIKFFDGMSTDLPGEAYRMNQFIAGHGGLDIMLVGIGTNGHIAMNEPGTAFDSVAHISNLADETKATGQKYFTEPTDLNQGITLGLRHFRESKLPILMANGKKKNAIIRNILSSTATEMLPASVIHMMQQGFVMLDNEAVSL